MFFQSNFVLSYLSLQRKQTYIWQKSGDMLFLVQEIGQRAKQYRRFYRTQCRHQQVLEKETRKRLIIQDRLNPFSTPVYLTICSSLIASVLSPHRDSSPKWVKARPEVARPPLTLYLKIPTYCCTCERTYQIPGTRYEVVQGLSVTYIAFASSQNVRCDSERFVVRYSGDPSHATPERQGIDSQGQGFQVPGGHAGRAQPIPATLDQKTPFKAPLLCDFAMLSWNSSRIVYPGRGIWYPGVLTGTEYRAVDWANMISGQNGGSTEQQQG